MGGTALLDDDDRFADLPPLPLTAPDASTESVHTCTKRFAGNPDALPSRSVR